jgi:hypothetical protein
MKAIQSQINKKYKVCFFKLMIIDFLLLLSYWHYQPFCEPCLDVNNCSPCLSDEQYFIIYLGIALNLLVVVYCLFKNKK